MEKGDNTVDLGASKVNRYRREVKTSLLREKGTAIFFGTNKISRQLENIWANGPVGTLVRYLALYWHILI
jgi:hypothetical protein